MIALLVLMACDAAPQPQTYPDKVAGVPMAGAAEGLIEVPVGTPMGGFSSRCKILGSSSKQDKRKSQYALAFDRSTGIVTPPMAKVLWLDTEDDHLVLVKFDAIYAYDGLVQRLEQELGDATGLDLDGKVVLTASHTHHMPANFSDDIHFYLGGDKFNREIFERYVQDISAVAIQAYDAREPAALGMSWNEGWDPDDLVYRDRRSDNDELAPWDDWEPGTFKDPYGNILRVDSAEDGSPIAMLVTFGIHGTLSGGDLSMWSRDSTGGLEQVLEEQFDEPVVVMHLQGSGGDASPAGTDSGLARTESIGELATPLLMPLYSATPTSDQAITTETASRHIPEGPGEIRVTRDGTVDWQYLPYSATRKADGELYNADGTLESSFDEWNFPYGAAFCGSEDPLIQVDTQSDTYPYSSCMSVDLLKGIIANVFEMDIDTFPLPIPSTMEAGVTTSLWENIPQVLPDGTTEERPLLIGFVPAEPTAMYGEQWRRRSEAELGIALPLLVGYAQDHEGYFLIPEDWIIGGYEPNINVWGPLQGEHVMEGMLTMTRDVVDTPKREAQDPLGTFAPTQHQDKPLPELAPDLTPDAGTWITEAPEYMWLPDGFETLELEVPETCPRVGCVVQIAWQGGDPGADSPMITLEQDIDGTWETVTSHSGRPISSTMTDILTAYTPDPLYPADALQTHMWWASWQAVGHVHDRHGLPEGSYRLVVDGSHYAGGDTSWPWTRTPYRLESDPFEVVATELLLELDGNTLSANVASPEEGWRLISLQGDSQGLSRISGAATLLWDTENGEIEEQVDLLLGGLQVSIPLGANTVTVIDAYGNQGSLPLP